MGRPTWNSPVGCCGSGGFGRCGLGRGLLGAGLGRRLRGPLLRLRRRRLLGPVLVELDPPLALVLLLQAQLRPEGPARAAAEARDRLLRAAHARLLAALA